MFHISINCLSIILWWFWTAKQTNPFIFSKLSQIWFVRNKNSSFEIKKCPYSKLIFGSGCGGRFPRLNKSWDIFLLKINYSTIRNKKKNWLRKYNPQTDRYKSNFIYSQYCYQKFSLIQDLKWKKCMGV